MFCILFEKIFPFENPFFSKIYFPQKTCNCFESSVFVILFFYKILFFS